MTSSIRLLIRRHDDIKLQTQIRLTGGPQAFISNAGGMMSSSSSSTAHFTSTQSSRCKSSFISHPTNNLYNLRRATTKRTSIILPSPLNRQHYQHPKQDDLFISATMTTDEIKTTPSPPSPSPSPSSSSSSASASASASSSSPSPPSSSMPTPTSTTNFTPPPSQQPQNADEEDSEESVDKALNNMPVIPSDTENKPAVSSKMAKPPSRSNYFQNKNSTNNNNGAGTSDFEIDVNAIYFTRCGKCTAIYEIDPTILGERGRKVSCSVCSNTWFQRADRLSILNTARNEFIDYPVDQKDELIAKNLKQRSEHQRDRRAPSPYNSNNNNSNTDRRERSYSNNNNNHNNSNKFSVFIANISYELEDDELRQLITPVLSDFRLTVVKDQQTGKSKGFAFCDCKSQEDMDKVIESLDGKQLKGRPITARVGRRNN